MNRFPKGDSFPASLKSEDLIVQAPYGQQILGNEPFERRYSPLQI